MTDMRYGLTPAEKNELHEAARQTTAWQASWDVPGTEAEIQEANAGLDNFVNQKLQTAFETGYQEGKNEKISDVGDIGIIDMFCDLVIDRMREKPELL